MDEVPIKRIVVASIGELLGGVKGTLINLMVRNLTKDIPRWSLQEYDTFGEALEAG